MSGVAQRLKSACSCALAFGAIAGAASGLVRGWMFGLNAGVGGFLGAGLAAAALGALWGLATGQGPLDIFSGNDPSDSAKDKLPGPSTSADVLPQHLHDSPTAPTQSLVLAGLAALGLIGIGSFLGFSVGHSRGASEPATSSAHPLEHPSLEKLEIRGISFTVGRRISCSVPTNPGVPQSEVPLFPLCDDATGKLYWLTAAELSNFSTAPTDGTLTFALRNGNPDMEIASLTIRMTVSGPRGTKSREYRARPLLASVAPLQIGDFGVDSVELPEWDQDWHIELVGAHGAAR